MTETEQQNLTKWGLIFNEPDTQPFGDGLRRTGFYADMRERLSDQAWSLVEKYAGDLA